MKQAEMNIKKKEVNFSLPAALMGSLKEMKVVLLVSIEAATSLFNTQIPFPMFLVDEHNLHLEGRFAESVDFSCQSFQYGEVSSK